MDNLFGDDEPEDFDSKLAEAEADLDAADVDLSPRNNPDLLGHEDVEAQLLADYNAGRFPHALILAGAPGIGKATLAFRLARFLLAQGAESAGLFGAPEKPTSLSIKPDHPAFRRVASSGHADLLTVEREFDEKKGRYKNDISVESVRKIAPFLRKTAAEDGWRVVIVDGAESLNASSQNALLKILEEPPSKALLVLTTSRPGAFLPTIRSRCRTVRLEPLADDVVATLLDKHAAGLGMDEHAALLRLAEGSIGRALRYHADGGVAVYKDLLTAAATLPELDTALAHDLAEKIGKFGADAAFETAREVLTGWCAAAARAAARGQQDADIVTLPRGRAFDVWEKMRDLFQQTERYNLDKRLCVLNAFLLLQNPDHQGLNP